MLIVRILIEKLFYLLRRQSFSFQIMSGTVYKYNCEIFLLYVPGVGSLTPRFVPGEGFAHNDCPRGRVFAPFESCPGGFFPGGRFWMKLMAALNSSNKEFFFLNLAARLLKS